MQAERMKKKQIGHDRIGCIGGIARHLDIESPRARQVLDAGCANQDREEENMQRPEPTYAPDQKSEQVSARRKFSCISMGDHKAAQHEEEIDEQPGAANE
jgi:hypothetical protein